MLQSRVEPDLFRPFITLTIDVQTRAGKVTVLLQDPEPGALTRSVEEPFSIPLSAWEVEAVSSRHVINQAKSGAPIDAPRDVGGRLFDAVCSGACRRLYADAVQTADTLGRGLSLQIRTHDGASSGLPWELLFDRSLLADFVARVPGQSITRRAESATQLARAPASPAAELTLATTLDDDDSAQQLATEMRVEGLALDVRPTPLREPSDLVDLLRGNGNTMLQVRVQGASTSRSGSGELWVGGRYWAADLLLQALGSGVVPPLFVLAGGNTDQIAVELGKVVPVVVGFRGWPTTGAAAMFLEQFYRALLLGLPVPASASRARTRVAYTSPGTPEWAAPVVVAAHANPLFPAPAPAARGEHRLDRTEGEDSRQEQVIRRQLAMDRANREALDAAWGSVEPHLRPHTVQRQIDQIEQRIKLREKELEARR